MSQLSETIRQYGTPLRSVKFIIGMNDKGQPMSMQITRNEFQNIYLEDKIVYIIKTFHESDKEVFSVFYLERFMTTEFELLEVPSVIKGTGQIVELINEVS